MLSGKCGQMPDFNQLMDCHPSVPSGLKKAPRVHNITTTKTGSGSDLPMGPAGRSGQLLVQLRYDPAPQQFVWCWVGSLVAFSIAARPCISAPCPAETTAPVRASSCFSAKTVCPSCRSASSLDISPRSSLVARLMA
jgi:hypothetical protein